MECRALTPSRARGRSVVLFPIILFCEDEQWAQSALKQRGCKSLQALIFPREDVRPV